LMGDETERRSDGATEGLSDGERASCSIFITLGYFYTQISIVEYEAQL